MIIWMLFALFMILWLLGMITHFATLTWLYFAIAMAILVIKLIGNRRLS